jgi:N-acetylmuramoyl-L-alanine amidase
MIHYTDMATNKLALDKLCDPGAEVSAHYLISRWGQLFHLVPEDMRAWHAGVGSYAGISDMNSHSIGIELDHPGGAFPAMSYTPAQLQRLLSLLRVITMKWSIPRQNIIGHSDFAPGRKIDPGPNFPWAMLAHHGFGFLLPEDWDQDLQAEPGDLSILGYDVAIHGVDACMEAYAQHFMGLKSAPGGLLLAHLAATLACNAALLR